MGDNGLSKALNWSQVILTITLPVLSCPLVCLTLKYKAMCVHVEQCGKIDGPQETAKPYSYANNWLMIGLGVGICGFLTVVVVYLLVNVGLMGGP